MTEPYNYHEGYEPHNYHKGCEGCIRKTSKGCLLYQYSTPEVEKCPCMDCIVKVMCTSMCSSRITTYSNLLVGKILGVK